MTKLFLSFSSAFNVGQAVRQEGPSSHFIKSGTPTMGGIIFIPIILLLSWIFGAADNNIFSLLVLTFAFCLIGFFDDVIKILHKKNMGLSASQKIFLQILITLIWGYNLLFAGHEGNIQGWLYLPFIVFVIIAAANATNLTDGLDGLLAGCAVIAFFSYYLISLKLGNGNISSVCIIACGTIIGFLFFNFNPAKIFMGDTGSLSIGALIAGISILLHRELLLIIIGGVFVIETLSVIFQVASFKLIGKRIFKMSPLHHHFELSGFSERRVVLGFWAAAGVLGIIGALIG